MLQRSAACACECVQPAVVSKLQAAPLVGWQGSRLPTAAHPARLRRRRRKRTAHGGGMPPRLHAVGLQGTSRNAFDERALAGRKGSLDKGQQTLLAHLCRRWRGAVCRQPAQR